MYVCVSVCVFLSVCLYVCCLVWALRRDICVRWKIYQLLQLPLATSPQAPVTIIISRPVDALCWFPIHTGNPAARSRPTLIPINSTQVSAASGAANERPQWTGFSDLLPDLFFIFEHQQLLLICCRRMSQSILRDMEKAFVHRFMTQCIRSSSADVSHGLTLTMAGMFDCSTLKQKQLNGIQPLSISLFTLSFLWHVKKFPVKVGQC